jgi:hypothetical protein
MRPFLSILVPAKSTLRPFRNRNYVGSEHILLGLLREDMGVAAQVLMNFGLTLPAARAEILALLGPSVITKRTLRSSAIPSQLAAHLTEKPAEKVEEPPATCPKCGGSRVVRIRWNCLHLCGRDQEDVTAERAILASKIGGNVPSWACLTCEPRWSEVHRLALQDHQWQLAKEEAVAAQDWDTAVRLRDAQGELRPQLTALVEELLGRP